MIVAFLPQCFNSGTPELISHHHLLLPVYISKQHLVKLLKPLTEGNRLRTVGTTFTDSPPSERLRGSSTWSVLCIMHFSLLFGIFQTNFMVKIRKIILSRKVSVNFEYNDNAFVCEWSSISPFIFNNCASSDSQKICLWTCSWHPWMPDIFSCPWINQLLKFSSFMKRENIFPFGHRARLGNLQAKRINTGLLSTELWNP